MVNPLEKTSKKNDIVQKGGEVSEKKSNFEFMKKSDILLREGRGWSKTNVIFSRCFLCHHLPIFRLILLHFEVIFQHYCMFFLSIFDLNNKFIIDF